jgi:hypothetical protein
VTLSRHRLRQVLLEQPQFPFSAHKRTLGAGTSSRHPRMPP